MFANLVYFCITHGKDLPLPVNFGQRGKVSPSVIPKYTKIANLIWNHISSYFTIFSNQTWQFY